MKRKHRALKPAFPFYSRENSCTGKIAYVDEPSAVGAARALRKKKGTGYMKAYRCLWCVGWHVGHPKRRSSF